MSRPLFPPLSIRSSNFDASLNLFPFLSFPLTVLATSPPSKPPESPRLLSSTRPTTEDKPTSIHGRVARSGSSTLENFETSSLGSDSFRWLLITVLRGSSGCWWVYVSARRRLRNGGGAQNDVLMFDSLFAFFIVRRTSKLLALTILGTSR